MKNLVNNFLLYLIATFLTCIILFWVVYVPGFNVKIPLAYQDGDFLVFSAMIKAILETKNYITNPFFAAPMTFSFIDFPIYTPLMFVAVRFLSNFFKDFASIYNVYYFSTYFLATVVALSVYRRLGLNSIYSLIASLLFSFSYYHLIRGLQHININTIFVIPIFVWLAIISYNTDHFFAKSKSCITKMKATRGIGYGLLAVLSSCCCSGGYFAFFGCYLLFIGGSIASLEKKIWAPFLTALVFISLTLGTFAITISPTIINMYEYDNRKEIQPFSRDPGETEVYGFKLAQLVFPINSHRIKALSDFTGHYAKTAPLINENFTSSLGLIGAIGFLISFLVLFVRRWQVNSTLYVFSIFNISCFILGTTGGLCSIIAYTISPVLHGCNRISIFISFLSLFAFFSMLQLVNEQYSLSKNKVVIYLMAILIFSIGLLDQVPNRRSSQRMLFEKNKLAFINDKQFIKQIEKTMPLNSKIFQLPVMGFPDLGEYVNGTHQHFIPYLHTNSLRWSYGPSNGSYLLAWQNSLIKSSTEESLKNIVFAGYTGIYLNKNRYSDKKAENFEKELDSITRIRPIKNQNGSILFYDLRSYIDTLKMGSPKIWESGVQHQAKLLALNMQWTRGFSELETSKDSNWRWCDKKGCLRITNVTNQNISIKISFNLQTNYPDEANMYLTGDLIHQKLKVNVKEVTVTKKLLLTPGNHVIKFKTDAKKVIVPSNTRSIYFRVNNFSLDD